MTQNPQPSGKGCSGLVLPILIIGVVVSLSAWSVWDASLKEAVRYGLLSIAGVVVWLVLSWAVLFVVLPTIYILVQRLATYLETRKRRAAFKKRIQDDIDSGRL